MAVEHRSTGICGVTGVNNWRAALPWPEGLPSANNPEAIEYLYDGAT